MARGFESKDVEFQQAEAARDRTVKKPLTASEQQAADRRRTIELALAKARADLEGAANPTYRRMLTRAIEALVEQLQRIENHS